MELRVLYIRTVLTSCKSLSALSSGRSSTARLTDLHRSQSTLTYILSERSLVHLTCGDATRLWLLSHMLSLFLFVRHHTWRFQAGNDVQKRRKSAWACWVPRSCSHRSTDRTHTLCGSSPIDALFLSKYLSGITRKKEKIELACSVDETWLPVVVDGQTRRTEKLGTSFKSKFLFPIDPDPSNHRCC